jgi:hypothetical protein
VSEENEPSADSQTDVSTFTEWAGEDADANPSQLAKSYQMANNTCRMAGPRSLPLRSFSTPWPCATFFMAQSVIWSFFRKESDAIFCLHCDWSQKADASSSTGNLWTHLESKAHGLKRESVSKAMKPGSTSSTVKPIPSFFQHKSKAEMMMSTVMIVAKDLRPFSLFQGEVSHASLLFSLL